MSTHLNQSTQTYEKENETKKQNGILRVVEQEQFFELPLHG